MAFACTLSSSTPFLVLLMILPPPGSTLFPCTRSYLSRGRGGYRGTGPAPPIRMDTLSDAMRIGKRIHRSEEHTSELQSRQYLVCRLVLSKKKVLQPMASE